MIYRFGIMQKGNKAEICGKIIAMLPKAETFVDLFAGGCSMTECALASRKYEKAVCNDLDGELMDFFVRSVKGDVPEIPEGKSYREIFYGNFDPMLKYCASFSGKKNNCGYSETKERFLKLEFVKLFRDRFKNIHRNMKEKKGTVDLSLISFSKLSYECVPIPGNAVVYADPPYRGTDKYYGIKFDNDAFFEWCRTRPFPVWVSEYSAPEDFALVAEFKKSNSMRKDATTEKLFLHRKWV